MRGAVFVSYSQTDRDTAFELVSRVEAHGLRAWIAPRDVAPSADWAAEIIDAIATARVMVLVLSASSNDSPQVRREVERAVSRQVRILPFRIDDVAPSKSLEYFLSSQHWLDAFPPPREPHYARLCAALDALFEDAGVPRVEPAPAPAPVAAAPVRPPTLAAADLQHVQVCLAEHVGPLARILVERAAAHASSVADLAARLAVEVDGERERHEFLTRCRAATRTPA